tara:strand:- start:35033 stop:36259 length:1227 start_codon:yes stop_codon:yes gene_type:complete
MITSVKIFFVKLMPKFLKDLILAVVLLEIFSLFFLILLKVLVLFNISIIPNENIKLSRYDLPHPSISELFLKLNKPTTYADPNTGWYDPYKTRFGVERSYYSNKNEDSGFNIFVLGGSTVEGDGSPTLEDSLVFKIQQKIRNINKCENVNVYNEGVSGFYSKQEFLHLTLRILKYGNPDYLIFIDGVNEHLAFTGKRLQREAFLFSNDWSTKELSIANILENQRNEDFFGHEGLKLKKLNNIIMSTFTGKLATTVLVTFSKEYKMLSVGAKLNILDVSSIDSLVENGIYYKNLSEKVIYNTSIKSLHVLQPVLFNKNFPTDLERSILNGVAINHGIFDEKYWNSFINFYDQYKIKLKSQEFSFLDLSELFYNSQDQDFVDHVHYTPKANEKIANEIVDFLRPNLYCSG